MPAQIEAQSFWHAIRTQLMIFAVGHDYCERVQWTCVATRAAEATCQSLGLKTQREYLRLDVTGYESIVVGERWNLRVAFESENDNWPYEMCKLTDVVADLHVLVLFLDYTAQGSTASKLDRALDRVRDRIARQRDSEWLFIVGPRLKHDQWRSLGFEAFRLRPDVSNVLEDITGEPRFMPAAFSVSNAAPLPCCGM